MGATPVLLLPYPEPSDPADVPTDMNELATRIETVRGAANGLASLGADGKVPAAQLPAPTNQVITSGQVGNIGPTGVTSTGTGDGFFNLNAGNPITVAAIPYLLEYYQALQGPAAAARINFRLMEGTIAAPGAQAVVWTIDTVAAGHEFHFVRVPFTPTAGSRNYHLRWQPAVAGTWAQLNTTFGAGYVRIVAA